jgi:hypothetical protein
MASVSTQGLFGPFAHGGQPVHEMRKLRGRENASNPLTTGLWRVAPAPCRGLFTTVEKVVDRFARRREAPWLLTRGGFAVAKTRALAERRYEAKNRAALRRKSAIACCADACEESQKSYEHAMQFRCGNVHKKSAETLKD